MPPNTPSHAELAAAEAQASLQRGNLARADLIWQSFLTQGVRPKEMMLTQARVALLIGEYATARRYFAEVLAVNPSQPEVAQALSQVTLLEAQGLSLDAAATCPAPQKFHLIKAWGCGFTSDVDHTLGHLLLAEMTGRTPVIHWGKNSLFSDDPAKDAWGEFFEPVSPHTLDDLRQSGHTFFPGKWNADNLTSPEINKMSGPSSRTPGILHLNQRASVTVGDFFTSVIELLPWVRPPHPLAHTGTIAIPEIEAAYRFLVSRYLKPRREILEAVETFAAKHFQGKEILAVHVRGSDKIFEVQQLAETHQWILNQVNAQLAANPALFIFLITDDAAVRAQYLTHFPRNLIMTECIRSSTPQGVHFLPALSRRQLGIELLIDMYLAARCDRLVGLGFTNVSNMILHLKEWPKDSTNLLGLVAHYHRNLVLHG